MAHQLIDHLYWDAGILEPGREGVPQVMEPVVRLARAAASTTRAAQRAHCTSPRVTGG
jgi:hypothetical protein